ncbi:MAG: sigma factor-like helix-turn-helix DNA-binding protein [Terracidiphilus sp.]|nr:sigma factor-like helix-turn-helix DNA-binding protein [Terracidiphilus sp.]
MSNDSGCCSKGLIPTEPLPPGTHEFVQSVTPLLDGRPKDDATVAEALAGHEEVLGAIAAGMYTIASMLVGEGEDSVQVIEASIANTAVSPCTDPEEGRRNNHLALAEAAIAKLAERAPGSLDAPVGMEFPHTCIDDDELESAGVTNDQLQSMIAGPDRGRVRSWLESLPVEQRAVFVLRAVAGLTSKETATLLAANGGPGAAGWTPESVREVFRQGLCSLASQLIQATHTSN